MTKIDRWLVQRQLCGSRPELKLVAVTAAPMAIVAASPSAPGFTESERRSPDGEASSGQLPYHRTPDRVESWKPSKSNTCSRDLPANGLEVDTGHGCSSLADGVVGCSRTVPFPFISIGGTGMSPDTKFERRNPDRV